MNTKWYWLIKANFIFLVIISITYLLLLVREKQQFEFLEKKQIEIIEMLEQK